MSDVVTRTLRQVQAEQPVKDHARQLVKEMIALTAATIADAKANAKNPLYSGNVKKMAERTLAANEPRLEAWRYIQEVLK